MTKGTLYIFCGKMASGKTTLAKEISQQKSAVIFSEDDLLGKLYPGEITDVPGYVQCAGKLKSQEPDWLITIKMMLQQVLRTF
ncbi:MAG: AAA family ATPase [Granulosicoccus sp.]